MGTLSVGRSGMSLCVAAILSAGCGGSQPLGTNGTSLMPSASKALINDVLPDSESSSKLFVSASVVVVYPGGVRNPYPMGTINDGINDPWNLAVDKHGTLFVQNNNDTITEYDQYDNRLKKTLVEPTTTGPGFLAVGPDGTVYAGNQSAGEVFEFGGGSKKPTLTLSVPGVAGLIVDKHNNLLVAYYTCERYYCNNNVERFRPGGTVGKNLNLNVSSSVTSLEVDKDDNLLVGQLSQPTGSILVFAPGQTTASRTIQIAEWAWQFSLDSHDQYLYVVGGSYPDQDKVYVYDYKTGRLVWKVKRGEPGITQGVAVSPAVRP